MGETDLKSEAEALRVALNAGLMQRLDIIKWADARIVALSEPDSTLIDLALAVHEDVERLAYRLASISGEANGSVAIRLLLRVLLERLNGLRADPRDIAEHLYALARSVAWSESEFGSEPFWLDDLFQPEAAFGGVYYRDALSALREYLERHAAPTQDIWTSEP